MLNTLLFFAETPVVDDGRRWMLLLTVFVLAVFVGIRDHRQNPAYAAHAIDVWLECDLGDHADRGVVVAQIRHPTLAKVLGCLAVIFATMNVVGGFLVTHRMLGCSANEIG